MRAPIIKFGIDKKELLMLVDASGVKIEAAVL